jgi:cell division septation protein DedD
MGRKARFRTKPTVNSSVGMSTGKLSSLEIKLGLIQVVIVLGVIMGAMLCAFLVGWLRGESSGFERALTSSQSNMARFPITEERHGQEASPQVSEVYAKLNDSQALTGKSEDEGAKDAVPELGSIRTTSEAPIEEEVKSAPKVSDKAAATARKGSADVDLLAQPQDELSEAKADGVTVLGASAAGERSKTLGSLVREEAPQPAKSAAAAAQGEAASAAKVVLSAPASKEAARRSENITEEAVPSVKVKPEPAKAERAVTALAAGAGSSTAAKWKEAKPEQPMKEAPPASVTSNLKTGWYAQIAAPQRVEDANKLAAKLRASGFPAVIEKAQVRGQQYFRVLAGPEGGRGQAEQLVGQLKRERYLSGDPFIRMVK